MHYLIMVIMSIQFLLQSLMVTREPLRHLLLSKWIYRGPSVVIHSPAHGQMYDISKPAIRVESSGVAKVETVSVTVDGNKAAMNDDGTYSPATDLDDGEYTVVAEVTDANGNTAEATAIFTVELPVPTAMIDTPVAGQVYAHGMPDYHG